MKRKENSIKQEMQKSFLIRQKGDERPNIFNKKGRFIMLQERVNELNSAILDIRDNNVFISGFMSEKMLNNHIIRGSENWSSMGLYEKKDIDFYNIKDNALIIVQKDGEEINRYQYKPIKKETIKFKNKYDKNVTRTFIIRESVYSNHYHFYFVINDKEKTSDDEQRSLLFENKNELKSFLKKEFNFQLEKVNEIK